MDTCHENQILIMLQWATSSYLSLSGVSGQFRLQIIKLLQHKLILKVNTLFLE